MPLSTERSFSISFEVTSDFKQILPFFICFISSNKDKYYKNTKIDSLPLLFSIPKCLFLLKRKSGKRSAILTTSLTKFSQATLVICNDSLYLKRVQTNPHQVLNT